MHQSARTGLLLALGALSLWVSYSLGSRKRARSKHKQAFCLAVGLKFQSVADRDAFLTIWRPLAEYVRAEEPVALSFEFLVADNDPTKALVHERYVSKDAFVNIHRTSKPFLAFKEAQQKLPFKVELSGQSYTETNIGFM